MSENLEMLEQLIRYRIAQLQRKQLEIDDEINFLNNLLNAILEAKGVDGGSGSNVG